MTIVAVGHAADERILVGLLGKFRQQLTDAYAVDVGLDGFIQRTLIVTARVGLGVKSVDVAGSTPQPDLDNGFGFPLDRFDGFGPGLGGTDHQWFHEEKPC